MDLPVFCFLFAVMHDAREVNLLMPVRGRADACSVGAAECRRLLSRVLEPLPSRRLTLRQVTVHPWLTHKGLSPLASYQHPRASSRQHGAVSTAGR